MAGEPDRMAAAALQVLHRNLVPLAVLEPWVGRLANAGTPSADDNAFPSRHNVQAFLRALHLQLVLGPHRPDVRCRPAAGPGGRAAGHEPATT